jgi:ribosomal protein S27AE
MDPARFEARWQELAAEVLSGFREWREQHPTATLSEIERALDERLDGLRARMLEDAALASRAADLRASQARPPCPECGAPMHADGRATRRLTTRGDRRLTLTRHHARCPACGAGLFPPR